MSRITISRYLTLWKYRREEEAARVAALRLRDGEECRRCRRALRFDLPHGHDLGPKLEAIASGAEPQALDNLCLTHGRCNSAGLDHTDEVTERIRRRGEAALLSRTRKRAA